MTYLKIMRWSMTISLFVVTLATNQISGTAGELYLADKERGFAGPERTVPYADDYETYSSARKRGWEALDFRGKRRVPSNALYSEKRGWEPVNFGLKPYRYPVRQSKRGWEFVNLRYRLAPSELFRKFAKRLTETTSALQDTDSGKPDTSHACFCCGTLEILKCCLECKRTEVGEGDYP